MLTVTYKGQSEPLTGIIRGSYTKRWELNGELSLSLESADAPDNPGYALLQEDAVITTVDGLDFRVLQISSTRGIKAVECLSTYYDLGGVIKHEIFGGTKTLREFMDWILAGTGWTADIVDVTHSALIPNFGDGENALKLIDQLLAAYECEREILPGNEIRIAKRLGTSNDRQFRVGHNTKGIQRTVDTNDVRTSITGYGGNGLVVKYVSPHADKFPKAGEAEPFKDERYTVRESLIERLKQELNDTPGITLEIDTLEVGDVEQGETVWAIDDQLDMVIETRVIAGEETDPERPKFGRVTLGNVTRKRIEDQLTDTNVRIDDTNDTVEENRKQLTTSIEQTNERITLRAEEVDKSLAEITLEAGQIRSYVEEVDNDLNGPGGAWSEIRQQAREISLKVNQEDFNGNNIVSEINQTATTIKIKAQNIELDGITRTAGNLQIGTKDAGVKELQFYFDYGYMANIKATQGTYGSGLEINSSDLTLGAWDHLYIGTSQSEVQANGDWNFTGTVTGITAVAVLG